MRVEDCYQLGYVTKTHGLKGELQIFLDVDFPEQYKNLESMFVLRNNALVPFFLEYIQINGNKALLKIDEINDIEEARPLISSEVYLPLSFLPELENDQFYYHELIGFELLDGDKTIGTVKNVYDLPNQDLIEVDHNGKEVLVPLNDEVITKVDKQAMQVIAKLPDGLLEIYLSDED
ncbi:MAG: 16S rRNA processing protein RimM [Cyclobacteriaceae bacterium]